MAAVLVVPEQMDCPRKPSLLPGQHQPQVCYRRREDGGPENVCH